MPRTRALVCALSCVVGLAAGATACGGGSKPSTTPEGPPNTGLPIAQHAQDVVNQQNQRTQQLEQQTGS